MRRRSAVTTTALVIFGIALGACDLGTPGPDESADPAGTTLAAEPSSDPTPTPGSLEDEYDSPSDMKEYAYLLRDNYLEPWLDDTWPGMPFPYVRFVAEGQEGRESCLDYTGDPAYYTSESYEYCEPDVTVYVGQDTLWEFFRETGDAGPAMGMAHEYGHHIQYQLGVDPPSTPSESIDFENQADCLAGVWARFGKQKGWLEEADDLDDIEQLFPLIASAEDEPDRDHGTLTERRAAFYAGYDEGAEGCGLQSG